MLIHLVIGATAVVAAASASDAALLATTPDVTPAALEAAAQRLSADGLTILTDQQLLTRLTGMSGERQPDETALKSMLADARENEARFDAAGAEALRRQIVRAFDECLRPSATLRSITAAALQDLAAGLLAEGRKVDASSVAVESLRRFPDAPLDTRRHPPAVQQLFKAAAATLAAVPTRTLIVRSDRPGTIIADGRTLGTATQSVQVALPAGVYRVWLEHDAGVSLPHAVDLTSNPGDLTIDSREDASIFVHPHVGIDCRPLADPSACARAVAALCSRLGATRCEQMNTPSPVASTAALPLGPSAGQPPSANAGAGAAPGSLDARVPTFSAWSLVPFGGGQLAQHRPVMGGAFMAGELGFLAWQVIATVQHNRASGGSDPDGAERWRRQQNLSAVLFWSSLGIGVGEALLYGLINGGED